MSNKFILVSEILHALTSLLGILDDMGLSAMPGDTNRDLREACEDARDILHRLNQQ